MHFDNYIIVHLISMRNSELMFSQGFVQMDKFLLEILLKNTLKKRSGRVRSSPVLLGIKLWSFCR